MSEVSTATKLEVTSSGIIFKHVFMKIHQMIQKLIVTVISNVFCEISEYV
jgi:hypothetical protein